MKIALGADHAGYAYKKEIMASLTAENHKVIDVGTHSDEPCDYPEIAVRVAKSVVSGRCERGILICGSGIGVCIAANKAKGVRAALAWNNTTATLAAQHNWANVLCLPSRFLTLEKIERMIRIWLKTPWEKGGRHERRVQKIEKLDPRI